MKVMLGCRSKCSNCMRCGKSHSKETVTRVIFCFGRIGDYSFISLNLLMAGTALICKLYYDLDQNHNDPNQVLGF